MQVPPALIQSLKSVQGFDETAFEAVHTNPHAVTSVRFNPLRTIRDQEAILSLCEQMVPWSSRGFYLSRRPSFTLDPLLHAGAYYVQEASSMFLETVCRQTLALGDPLLVLDLCAAPGGKTTLLQSILSTDSLLVSNEVIQSRVHILKENVIKWGSSNVVVTHNDPRDFQRCAGLFDVLVVDAPCSGSGLFRRDPNAIAEWSLSNVELCHQRQQRILADAWDALKEEGVLIYSTCSFSPSENEAMVDWLMTDLGASSLQINTKLEWNIDEVRSVKGGWGYRFWPHKTRGEGFFIAAFRKTHTTGTARIKIKKTFAATRAESELLPNWVKQTDGYECFKQGQNIALIPQRWNVLVSYLMEVLKVRYAGTEAGILSQKDFIPEHALALSHLIKDTIPSIDLECDAALEYLRKNELPVPTAKKGWLLARYGGLNLGWLKHLGNRMNNYYPKEYRILMSKRL